jgi:hypothetical protein
MAKKITLDEMVAALSAAYGTELRSVVLYGSAASSAHMADRSDYNLLIIVDTFQLLHVQRASDAVSRWAAGGNPPPLTFTKDEWAASGDIFPLEYADVLESHRVLHGSFELAGASIDLEHMRLQLEQEAMGKLLAMRQGAMMAGSRGRARVQLMESAWSKILVLLRGLIRLHGERPPAGNGAIVDRAAVLAAFDAPSMRRIMQSVSGEVALKDAESDMVLGRTLATLEILVSHINSFRPALRTYNAAPVKASMGDTSR